MNNYKTYLALPMALAMAGLLMVAVVAEHRVCGGVPGCALLTGTRGGLAGGSIKTGTYTYAPISQFTAGAARIKPPVGENRNASGQSQSLDEGR